MVLVSSFTVFWGVFLSFTRSCNSPLQPVWCSTATDQPTHRVCRGWSADATCCGVLSGQQSAPATVQYGLGRLPVLNPAPATAQMQSAAVLSNCTPVNARLDTACQQLCWPSAISWCLVPAAVQHSHANSCTSQCHACKASTLCCDIALTSSWIKLRMSKKEEHISGELTTINFTIELRSCSIMSRSVRNTKQV